MRWVPINTCAQLEERDRSLGHWLFWGVKHVTQTEHFIRNMEVELPLGQSVWVALGEEGSGGKKTEREGNEAKPLQQDKRTGHRTKEKGTWICWVCCVSTIPNTLTRPWPGIPGSLESWNLPEVPQPINGRTENYPLGCLPSSMGPFGSGLPPSCIRELRIVSLCQFILQLSPCPSHRGMYNLSFKTGLLGKWRKELLIISLGL